MNHTAALVLVLGCLLVACQQAENGTTTGGSGAGTTTGSQTTGGLPVTTLAGAPSSIPDQCQAYGDAGQFDPDGLAVDPSGNVYVVSANLDEVSPSGTVSVFLPENVLAPSALAFAPSGAFYAAEGDRIFSISGRTPNLLAGGTLRGSCGDTGDDAGVGFYNVNGIAADVAGNVFVADRYPQQPDGGRGCERIRKVDSAGNTTTIAGTGWPGFKDDADGSNAQFNDPEGIAIDGSGNLYVADTANNRIRKIAPGGATTTLAGNGQAGFEDGTGGASGTASFNKPVAVACDPLGNVYVADFGNQSIREVAPDGTTTTVAGNGIEGDVDGTLGRIGTTEFDHPVGIGVGPEGAIYVADYSNCRLRVIQP